MNLHRKSIQDCTKNEIARESEYTSKEVAKHDDFIGFGSRDFLIKRSATIANRKKLGCLIFSNQSAVTFDSPNTKDGGYALTFRSNKLVWISIHVCKILFGTRLILRSDFAVFTIARIVNLSLVR
jgi:hypothetical protein